MEKASKRHMRRPRLGEILLCLGLAFGLLAVGLSLHQHALLAVPAQSSRSNAPSAVKPKSSVVASYTVPASNPKYITTESIGVKATRVKQLGLTKDNQIAVPDNIYDAGWYNGSAKPGQPGALFIYGHASNWQANGIFHDLKKLTPGNEITVTRGDNTSYHYRVVSSKVYPHDAVPMDTVLAAVDPSKPGLNLMTCTGTVIKGTSEFSERLVVFASLSDK